MRRDSQVLICPRCQASDDWTADLARCPRCGSVHLVRRLGEVECRDCGTIVPPSAGLGEGEPLAEAAGSELAGSIGVGSAGVGITGLGSTGRAARVLTCRKRSPGHSTGCSAAAW